MKGKTSIWIFAIVAILVASACKDPGKDPLEYDRGALTANLADNVILPAYTDLLTDVNALQVAQRNFRAQGSVTTLDALQLAWQDTWLGWKACSAYEFGPAASVSLRLALNTFPSDTVQIWQNVSAGTWDLNLASNIDARGFPALDYLLFGLGNDDSAVLTRYQAPADSARLQGYLAALVSDAQTLVSGVQGQWSSGYAATFKASQGTDVGSSTSLLVNAVNRDLELIKQASLGIPLGKETFGTPLPGKVEAPYSGLSEALAIAQLDGIMAAFWGHAPGKPDGYGLDDALIALEAAYGSGMLVDAISAQSAAASAALQAMPDPLDVAVVNNPTSVDAAYAEIQKLVVLMKADMSSALSILITYTDSDGD